MKSTEVQLNEALATIETQKGKISQLEESITAGRKATAKAERDAKLKESKLPAPCVERLSKAFENSVDNAGLQEAINTEKTYVESLTKTSFKNGQGVQVSESSPEQLKERQKAAYKASGYTDEQIKRLVS